ncbi:sugar kinases, ribokinase family [Anaerolinea thermolimosa]|uniref:carbohydrate kinase family protein n=1 Tax=Anaerolinea thermolimosa TaxID=229919 RepID=UPI0007813B54|nr:PfkB family carbohydrate kinase [Anaerolinea thermolimosa]GAP06908.1 sugar kinases, ribokinase family [Anaerolinea thermolimosa]
MNASSPRPLQIVGLGMATIDVLVRLTEMPTWEKNTRIEELILDGGGPVGTALVAAARLGARTGFYGTAGNDPTADFKLHLFEKEGIDISHVLRRPLPEPQIILVCVHSQTGERTFFGTPSTGAFPLQPEELDRSYITQAEILHLDGFHPRAAIQAARWMREEGKLVVLDAGKTEAEVSPSIRELIPFVHVLISGDGFSRALTGINDLHQAGQCILLMGPRIYVETLGERGSFTISCDEAFFTPAYPVKVVDTTGAGDVFHGAFLVGLLKRWPLREIARFASAVAAIKCTSLGGRRGIPSLPEVEEFLNRDYLPKENEDASCIHCS